MNRNELAAQIEFFRDIGLESLSLEGPSSRRSESPAVPAAPAARATRSSTDTANVVTNKFHEPGFHSRELGDCQRCKLAPKRTNIVFGSGSPNAELVFVGEAPGYDEDVQGLPFVGRAGQLLTKIIESIDLKRDQVYICNVLKCRPS
jgi:DNA polymerase